MNRLTGWLDRQAPWIDWIIRVIGTVGIAMMILLYGDFRSYVDCQAAYNESLNTRTRVLTEVTDEERRAQRAADDAERKLFTDPALSTPAAQRTPAERERITVLFHGYQTALTNLDVERRDADAARAQNPVPEPPSQRCG